MNKVTKKGKRKLTNKQMLEILRLYREQKEKELSEKVKEEPKDDRKS